MYLALYARRAWVIFDHPYNAEYLFPFVPRCWAAAERISAIYGGPVACDPKACLKFLLGNTL